MRSVSGTMLAYLTSRSGVKVRSLLWITGRDRNTGAAASMGFWNGDDHETVTIDGTAREYYGAGTIIGIDALQFQTGLAVQMQHVTMAATAPEVSAALLGYDPRFARVEIHRAVFDPVGGALIENPQRIWVGTLDQAPVSTPSVGGAAGIELTLASATRWLTKSLPIKKSDAALRARSSTDGFRKYAAFAGEVPVLWGDGPQRISAAPTTTTTTTNPLTRFVPWM